MRATECISLIIIHPTTIYRTALSALLASNPLVCIKSCVAEVGDLSHSELRTGETTVVVMSVAGGQTKELVYAITSLLATGEAPIIVILDTILPDRKSVV